MKLVGKYFPTPAYNSCVVYSYVTECFKKSDTKPDPDEILETVIYSKKEVKKMLAENKIRDMKTYISNAPVTGTPLFNLKAITEAKKNIDLLDIQTDLNHISKKLGVEIVAFKLNK